MSDQRKNDLVKVFAPVNIAWIKYMGKSDGRPTNSSLSLTLATLGTHTSMIVKELGSELRFEWSEEGYIPPAAGQKKAEDFLRKEQLWTMLLKEFGFQAQFPKATIRILTQNNIPAGTGIATSASAFASLTLAWSAILAGDRQADWIDLFQSGHPRLRNAMAVISALGSGSSSRSFDGPWVEWNPTKGISVIDGGETEWMDFIFLVESGPKGVPSSDAHLRVLTSPKFQGRMERAEYRLNGLKLLLPKNSYEAIQELVLEEAMDMHELFHTAVPAFEYMTPLSKEIVEKAKSTEFPSVITLDAGANVHMFVPIEHEQKAEQWIQKHFPQVKTVKDITGYGARYE